MSDRKRSSSQSNLGSRGDDSKAPRSDFSKSLAPTVANKLAELVRLGLMKEEDLDEQARTQLTDFFPSEALDVLEKFVHCDVPSIRNKSAFLCTVMRKQRETSSRYQPLRDVMAHLNYLSSRGKIRRGDLDGRCMEALETLSPAMSMQVLDTFANKDMANARNPAAIFMACIKEVQREEQLAPRHLLSRRSDHDRGSYLDDDRRSSQRFEHNMSHTFMDPPQSSNQISFDPPPSARYEALTLKQEPVSTPMPANPIIASMVSNRTYHGVEQQQYGVRVKEFHQMSVLAPYVHPAPALKLQQLWDSGVKLVAHLDDPAWESLADLGGPEALAVLDEVAMRMESREPIRNISALFMTSAKPFLERRKGPDRMASGTGMGHRGSSGGMTPSMAGSAMSQGGMASMGGALGVSGGARAFVNSFGQGNGFSQSSSSRGDRDGGDEYVAGRDPAYDRLSSALQQKVEAILRTQGRYLQRRHFDETIVLHLNTMSEPDAELIIEELATNDLGHVRNMPAFIMGILKRYRKT